MALTIRCRLEHAAVVVKSAKTNRNPLCSTQTGETSDGQPRIMGSLCYYDHVAWSRWIVNSRITRLGETRKRRKHVVSEGEVIRKQSEKHCASQGDKCASPLVLYTHRRHTESVRTTAGTTRMSKTRLHKKEQHNTVNKKRDAK